MGGKAWKVSAEGDLHYEVDTLRRSNACFINGV